MEVLTTRFGPVPFAPENRVEFPTGLVGVPQLKRFVLIRDPKVANLTWLQSTRDPAWAMALMPPRLIVLGYQARASLDQLRPIQATESRNVDVFVTLNRTVQHVTANLQAPILINRRNNLGVQIVLSDSQYDVRHVINQQAALRKSA